jgi:hypothetical protein
MQGMDNKNDTQAEVLKMESSVSSTRAPAKQVDPDMMEHYRLYRQAL